MTVLVLQPDHTSGVDNYIREFNPNANSGVATSLWIGITFSTTARRRILIKFDLSSLPPPSIISSAILSLYCVSENTTTNYDATIHKSLVEWYEGAGNISTPGAGVDASTWNFRNHNGSVAWSGGAGGGAGSDFETVPSDTVSITATNTWFDFDVTADVQNIVDGSDPNHGWWVLGVESAGEDTLKGFVASDDFPTRPDFVPKLTITYTEQSTEGSTSGSATVTGILTGAGYLSGSASGSSLGEGLLESNEYLSGLSEGEATGSATIFASGYMAGSSSGVSSSLAEIRAEGGIVGASSGTSVAAADIFGSYEMEGSSQGTSSASAIPSFEGRLRGSSEGTSSVTGTMWGSATGKATPIGCNTTPLFYITDGFIRTNGQKNLLNFLSEGSGFKLKNWRPQISQYKEGGRFSNGPLSQGRRLRYRNFDNAIEVFELAANSSDQDTLIEFQRELLAWQEAAADYWVSDYVVNPVYLVAKSARETNTRYAIIHMISIPELENPYAQPFFNIAHAAMETITVRVERGHWLSTPPGKFDCVPVSSVRSWTVSGWETGS